MRKLKEYKKSDYITVWYKLKKIIFWKFVWRKLNRKEQNFVIMSCDWWDKLTGAGTESWKMAWNMELEIAARKAVFCTFLKCLKLSEQ